MEKMKLSLQSKLTEYIWNTLNKVTNTSSTLTVNNLGNGYVKCFWEISSIDNFRIKFSKSFFMLSGYLMQVIIEIEITQLVL